VVAVDCQSSCFSAGIASRHASRARKRTASSSGRIHGRLQGRDRGSLRGRRRKLKNVIEAYPDDPDVHIAYYNIACGYATPASASGGDVALAGLRHGYGCTHGTSSACRGSRLAVVRPLPSFRALFEQRKRVQQIEQSWPRREGGR
jgi:hypothetical protein